MTNEKKYDLIIIGGGPAGYVGAIRAAQLGMSVLVIEKEHLGGTCLNIGCIPTKALFQSAEVADTVKRSSEYGIQDVFEGIDYAAVVKRKDAVVKKLVSGVGFLFKKNKVDHVMGEAYVLSAEEVRNMTTGEVYTADHILIATGSSNAMPPISGLNSSNVLDSTMLLSLTECPKSIVIIGGGVIGCEFAGILNAFGTKVTIVEMLPHLISNMEEDLSKDTERQFKKSGIGLELNSRVIEVKDQDGQKCVVFEKNGQEVNCQAEYVLVCTGRKANSTGMGLEELGVDMEKGFIRTDEYMRTNIDGIYAAGDITGKGMLAHTAFEGGIIAVENMAGIKRALDLKAVPKVVFVEGEAASVGLTEKEAAAAGYQVLTGTFPLMGNGKALAMGKPGGFIKVIAEAEKHTVLGIHIKGACASEMITTGTQIVSSELKLEDIIDTIYPHPALSEAIREACMAALNRAIHC